MTEIALGTLALLAAAIIVVGTGDTLPLPTGDLFPILGFAGAGAIAIAGAVLILHGAYRRARRRKMGNQHALRTFGLASFVLALIVLLTLAIPLLVEPLNIIEIGGFPLGFYLAAQGSPIALVILAFIFARRQGTIDAEERATGE